VSVIREQRISNIRERLKQKYLKRHKDTNKSGEKAFGKHGNGPPSATGIPLPSEGTIRTAMERPKPPWNS
jgi:hypothetical protein